MKKACLILLLNFMLLIFGSIAEAGIMYERPICGMGAERLYNMIKSNSAYGYTCYPLVKPAHPNYPLYTFDVANAAVNLYGSIGVNDAGYATMMSIGGQWISKQSKQNFVDFTKICLRTIGLNNEEVSYLLSTVQKDQAWERKDLEKMFGKEDHYISTVYSASMGKTIQFSIYLKPSGQISAIISARN